MKKVFNFSETFLVKGSNNIVTLHDRVISTLNEGNYVIRRRVISLAASEVEDEGNDTNNERFITSNCVLYNWGHKSLNI